MTDKNISELQTAAEVALADFMHLRQGGIDRKATVEQVRSKFAEDLVNKVPTYEALRSFSSVSAFDIVYVLGRTNLFDGAHGVFVVDTTDTASVDNDGTILVDAAGRRWKRQIDSHIDVRWFGVVGDGVADDYPPITKAITAAGGTYDLDSAYIYEPAIPVYVPAGVYGVSQALFINKNNVVINGDGMFNTTIKCLPSVQITEVVRFQGAYACELNNLTIDGGLPFTPTATETYGADVGLTLDQVAHFRSEGLNICNTRYEGKRCIHLWESYFEDLRIFNTGFFGNATNRSAGIRFTLVGKQENKFPGGESNNITYSKVAFGCVGSYVSMDEVPAYNVYFSDVIAEGRTWPTQYASSGEAKWRIGGTSNNIVINGGYSYPHAQSYNANATLFEFTNVGPGCRVKNYRVYAELDNTYQEISTVLSCDSYSLIDFDVSVEEVGSTTIKLVNSSTITTVSGSWEYKTDGSRTIASLFNGSSEARFKGSILFRAGGVSTDYDYRPNVTNVANAAGDISARPVFNCYAWASYNGVAGSMRGAGGVTATKASTGQYNFTFDQPMPDSNYSVVVSANILNTPGEKPEIGTQSTTGFSIANRSGATYYDVSLLNVQVFR